MAQIIEASMDETSRVTETPIQNSNIIFPRCQVDASWAYDNLLFGGGLVLDLAENIQLTGSFVSTQVPAPIYAELHTLLWAMNAIRQLGLTSIGFESDCLQLVQLIEEEEDWPSLTTELEEFYFLRSTFISFSLTFIPRNFNVRTDALSKEARARGYFFSHVKSLVSSQVTNTATLLGTP